ncbi:MAG: ABC transporter ATP-binding protein [Pseudomonadota bacterium]
MTSPSSKLLATTDVTKFFGSFCANDRISLDVEPGEIHALLGENGAGKSTFVKALYGLVRPDSGTITWKGERVEITSPARARELGIGMVFQHFALFDSLNVAENIALALPQDVAVSDVVARLDEITARYGLALNAEAAVGDLSAGERQRIEIVRCLMQSPTLIILDEPTSVLTPQEADQLFVTLRQLVNEGRSIIYISHKLEEVQRLCDRATILRHGRVVADCDPRTTEKGELARLMVGDLVHAARPSGSAAADGIALSVRALSMAAPSLFGIDLQDISLDVRPGQICAIAGIAGNGQSELFEALSGERLSDDPAAITLLGQPVGHLGIAERRQLGADFVSDERLGHATAPDMSLSDNVLVTRARTDTDLMRSGVLKLERARSLSQRIQDSFDVRSGAVDPPANALSGGNLQKFVIGRAVDRHPRVLVVNQPTWGVDAGAAARIRKTLVSLAEGGSAIVVISQDLDEIFEIADSIAVITRGRLTALYPADQMSAEEIGLWMSNADAGASQRGTSTSQTAGVGLDRHD